MKKVIIFLMILIINSSILYSKEVHVYLCFKDLQETLLKEFEKETGIEVILGWDKIMGTNEVIEQLEKSAGNPKASIWISGVGLGHIEGKNKNLTIPYRSPFSKNTSKEFKDKDYYWTGLYIGSLSIGVNTKLAKEQNLKIPNGWDDLIKSEYRNKIRMANPNSSGTAYNVITTILDINNGNEKKTFKYLKKLDKNINFYTKSGSQPGRECAKGEIPIAIGYSHDFLMRISEGAPIKIISPKEGTGFEISAISLIKNGPDIENAKIFYNWILSKKGQDILAKHFVIPVSKIADKRKIGVVNGKRYLDIGNLISVKQDMEWDAENKKRLIEKWNNEIGRKNKNKIENFDKYELK